MNARIFLIAALVLLSGCEPSQPRKTIANTPTEFAQLTPGAQIALALEFPLIVVAIGFALHGFTLLRFKRVTTTEAKK